jgi:hypothetical protein
MNITLAYDICFQKAIRSNPMEIRYRIKRNGARWTLFDGFGQLWNGSSVQELLTRLLMETNKIHIEVGTPNGYPL